jgi:hypothetical protein
MLRRSDMIAQRLFLLTVLSLPLPAQADAPAIAGLQRDVPFDAYSPLSRSAELLRRMLSPLTTLHLQRALADSQQTPREQAIDLAHEKFAVYVSSQEPAQGYALLVFVPPWEEASVPQRWLPVLDRHGMIFVSAANSGNAANVLDRREPLALLAAYNIMRRYRVDPSRVYISGFSGGSRVALRLALGYPDLFRGALLDAGSDPIGDTQVPLPPVPLFRQFQESTRLVYLTGNSDAVHLDQDAHSRQSMHDWCVFDLDTENMPRTGHETADAPGFDSALSALTKPGQDNAEKISTCRARVDKELAMRVQEVEDLLDHGRIEAARSALIRLDARYGGMATPRTVELAEKINTR